MSWPTTTRPLSSPTQRVGGASRSWHRGARDVCSSDSMENLANAEIRTARERVVRKAQAVAVEADEIHGRADAEPAAASYNKWASRLSGGNKPTLGLHMGLNHKERHRGYTEGFATR